MPLGRRFEWVDGALTRAIEEGRWVLLDNANMCMATVLDRLNPLLEPAGTLLLNEAGTANGRPRVLRPHPNFRLILALDPKSAPLPSLPVVATCFIFLTSLCGHTTCRGSSARWTWLMSQLLVLYSSAMRVNCITFIMYQVSRLIFFLLLSAPQ